MKRRLEIRDRLCVKQKRSMVFSRMIRILFVAMIFVLPAGCKSIQQAAREGDIKHIKTLLALGVNINSRTWFGDQGSALHRASSAGQTETVTFLIKKGANVNIKDEASVLPIHRAAQSGHAEIVKILLDNGAFPSPQLGYTSKVPLNYAARGGHIEAAKVLLEHGATIDAKGVDKYTALGTAAAAEEVEMVTFLLSRGADVNAKALYDRTPLFTAVGRRSIELARLLLEAGAEPNIMCNGRTALITSVFNGDVKMTELLLAHGADVNARIVNKITPLYMAYRKDNIEIGRILLKHGADPAPECDGRKIPQSFVERLRE